MLTALLWRIFYHEEDNVIEFDVQVTCFNLRNGLRRIVKKDRSKEILRASTRSRFRDQLCVETIEKSGCNNPKSALCVPYTVYIATLPPVTQTCLTSRATWKSKDW